MSAHEEFCREWMNQWPVIFITFKDVANRTFEDSYDQLAYTISVRMMYEHYGKSAILLIDEYDVPLAKAREYGYYEEMLDCIRTLMSKSFKTNDYLQFAVVTGSDAGTGTCVGELLEGYQSQ